MTAPEDYCREIEAYLCRKNDGHLIRIVGPAFEQVSEWARDGIPLNVARAGVDRYFERYYRKGPRRRPVRIEFCEADVRDAFDDWRRAVGVARSGAEAGEDATGHRRASLAAHIERAIQRLTARRGSTHQAVALDETLVLLVRRLDVLAHDAKRARGEARAAITQELEAVDRQLRDAAIGALTEEERAQFAADAARELEPFRSRMVPDAFERARAAAFERLARQHFGLPVLKYD